MNSLRTLYIYIYFYIYILIYISWYIDLKKEEDIMKYNEYQEGNREENKTEEYINLLCPIIHAMIITEMDRPLRYHPHIILIYIYIYIIYSIFRYIYIYNI